MATSDIAPGLLENLQTSFNSNLAGNKKASSLLEKINSGNANYTDAGNYADEIGKALADAMSMHVTSGNLPDGKMYWNIAERAIKPMYEQEYELASEAATTVQKSLNRKANIGLNARTAKLDEDSLKSILDMFCAADYEEATEELFETAAYFARQTVDETLKSNEEFQYSCGRHPKVIRRAGMGCCTWCAEVEGTYEYPNVPSDVYRRHDYCKCSVDYDPGDSSGKVQDVWDKDTWRSEEDAEKLEERKTYGMARTYDKYGNKIKPRDMKPSLEEKERLKTLHL